MMARFSSQRPGSTCTLAVVLFGSCAAAVAQEAPAYRLQAVELSADASMTPSGTLVVVGPALVGEASNTQYRIVVGPLPAFLLRPSQPVPADFDRDGDVDAADLGAFESCTTGPDVPYAPGSLPEGCSMMPDPDGLLPADFDKDRDLDQTDFGYFQRCYSGPNSAADPNCTD